MKWIVFSLLTLMLSVEARENPFEPTIAYMEEEQRILEVEQDYPEEFQAKENPDLEEISQPKVEEKKVEPKKSEVKKVVKKAEPKENKATEESHIKKLLVSLSNQLKEDEIKGQKEVLEKPMKEETAATESTTKEMTNEKAEEPAQEVKQENIEEETVLEDSGVPQDDEIAKESYDPTPFVSIKSFSNRLEIHTDSKVYRKFNLVDVSKIVIDFHDTVNFYTKRMNIQSDFFEEVAVGNHKKEDFYRVVVKTTQAPQSYKVTHKPGIITVYIP